TANEGDCVLVGAHDRRFLAWQIDIEIGETSPAPPQGEAGAVLGLKHDDDAFFEQRAQQFLAIASRGGRRFPYALQVGTQRQQAAPVFCAECSRSFAFAPGELGFGPLELAQALLPFALQGAGAAPRPPRGRGARRRCSASRARYGRPARCASSRARWAASRHWASASSR